MAQQIALEVVTPAGAVVSEEVDIVNAPGYGGDFGVLANHASSNAATAAIAGRLSGRRSSQSRLERCGS